jgi:NADPH-dependent glutamate synthase beta subunit-like oxidoreductase
MKKILLTVDGYKIEAKEGQNLLQAILDAGIYVPHLCYHPDLTPLGNCKLCTVELGDNDELVQSCDTKVCDGMNIKTNSDKVKKVRALALELILASHPKDCTSCDKYLNCELQALMQYMGVAHSRLREIEKESCNIPVSDSLIKKEMFRCIQCGRCIRACEELRGVGILTFNKKNGETYVNTIDDKALMEIDCRLCGACVEVCPTGAIQDAIGVFLKDSPKNLSLIPCKDRCPAHTDIPLYIRLVKDAKYTEAVSVLREKLTFPHSLGYVCNHVCEDGCKRVYVNESINIRDIKRFAVENDKEKIWQDKIKISSKTEKKVAIIGGGPCGLTAAYNLSRKGHDVTVFEKQSTAGGMLSYGIPKYRLNQEIVNNEIDILLNTGFKILHNSLIKSVDEVINKGFDAILVSVGAQKGRRPDMYNSEWENSFDAVEFCRLSIEGNLPKLGDNLIVYGGGNVAFDCARTAKKLGVKNVKVVCLEEREKMLADSEEIEAGLEEGIEILNSKFLRTIEEKNNSVTGLNLVNVLSFKFDKNGINIETEKDSEFLLNTDTLIFATGQKSDLDDSFGVELLNNGFVKTDNFLKTNKDGVFAAGDSVYGTKSVIEAIAAGREASENIDKYLGGDGNIEENYYKREIENPCIGVIEDFSDLERVSHLCSKADAKDEAKRCLQCDLRLDIKKVRYWVDSHYKQVKEVIK